MLRLRPRGADADDRPALTVFLWRNGASFDTTMNEYMSAAFTGGIDPRNPGILKLLGAFNSSGDTVNSTLSAGIEVE